jgi:hypothetical protein
MSDTTSPRPPAATASVRPDAVQAARAAWRSSRSSQSNIFVEPSTLPAALEWCVGVNPVSHLVTATREIMAGGVDAGHVLLVRGEAALLTASFAPLTARLYGRAG